MPMAPACKKKPPEELNSSGGSVIEDPFIPFYRKQYKHTSLDTVGKPTPPGCLFICIGRSCRHDDLLHILRKAVPLVENQPGNGRCRGLHADLTDSRVVERPESNLPDACRNDDRRYPGIAGQQSLLQSPDAPRNGKSLKRRTSHETGPPEEHRRPYRPTHHEPKLRPMTRKGRRHGQQSP